MNDLNKEKTYIIHPLHLRKIKWALLIKRPRRKTKILWYLIEHL
jgi:hypothetical protein